MCNCSQSVPQSLRSILAYAMERWPSSGIYDALYQVEFDLSRADYHRLLRWADMMGNCPHCAPKIHARQRMVRAAAYSFA